jgi:hypothetical protein
MSVWYTTREQVKAALDVSEVARSNARIDAAIEAASRLIDGQVPGDGLLHRRFYPEIRTARFDWPNYSHARPWRLYLGANEVTSVDSLVSGGVTITDYFLEPATEGPPYDSIEINLAGTAAFAATTTFQRSTVVTGTFCGCPVLDNPAGALAEDLDASETGVDVTDSSLIGVGHILKCGTERMLVTGKSMLTTAQTVLTPLTAATSNVTVAVTTGSAFAVGETILADSERMLIVDIAGNNLTVKRAYDGTVLAAHNSSTIYAPRTLTVTRGALGTTAATHLTAAVLTTHAVPGLVGELALAEALNMFEQGQAGYARVVGSGPGARQATGAGLEDLRSAARAAHGRTRYVAI